MTVRATPSQWTYVDGREEFLAACRHAARDDDAFRTFRQDRAIRGVVETKPAQWAPDYLEPALASGALTAFDLKAGANNDKLGTPELFADGISRISATTAYYLSVYAQIKALFGRLTGSVIAEVGAGYGGLATIICQCEELQRYDIYDLPDVLALAKRFCNRVCRRAPIKYLSQYDSQEYDLLISSCAMAEFTDEGWQEYAPLVHAARRGFFPWNFTPTAPAWTQSEDTALARLVEMFPDKGIHRASDHNVYRRCSCHHCQIGFAWGTP